MEVTLKEELATKEEKIKILILRIILLVAQLQTLCEIYMARAEDLMEEKGIFKYTIKRMHNQILKLIHTQYGNIYKTFKGKVIDDYVRDNQELQTIMDTWGGLDDKYNIYLREKKGGNEFTMRVNIIGDISLTNKEGWTIKIPKAIAQSQSIVKTKYEEAIAHPEGIKVTADFFIN